MAFDISTAKPVGGFDLSTARPIEEDELGLGAAAGPQSQSSSGAPDPVQDDNTWEDTGRQIMAGGADVVSGAGWLADRAASLQAAPVSQALLKAGGNKLKELGDSAAEYWREGISPYSKELEGKPLLKPSEDSITGYEWGDLTAGQTVDKVQSMLAGSLYGTAAGMGAGAGITSGLKVIPGVSSKIAAMLGFGSGEALVAAPMSGAQAEQEVRNMSDEDLSQHVEYQAMMLEDVKPEEARETIARAAGGDAASLTAVSTFFLSSPFGHQLDKVLGGEPGSLISGFLKGSATEGAQETLQSGAEQLSINAALQANADPNRSLGKDVAESMAGGLAAGAAMGGGFGAAAGRAEGRQRDIDAAAERAAQEAEARGGDLLDQQIARHQVYWQVDMPTDAGVPPGPPTGPDAPIAFEPYKPGINALKDQPYTMTDPVTGQEMAPLTPQDAIEYQRPEMPGEGGLSLAPLDQQQKPVEQPGNTIEFTPRPSALDEKSGAIEKAAAAYQQQKEDESLLSGAPPEREPVTVPDDYAPAKPALQEVHERVKAELDAQIKDAPTRAAGGTSKTKLADKDREILHAIAGAGGLSREEAEAHGIDPAEFGRREGGLNLVFKAKGGKSFDEMAETLSQHGFFGDREYTANELLDKVSKSLSGKPVYSETSDVAAQRVASQAEIESLEKTLHQFEIDSYEDADEPPRGKLFAAGVDSERKLSYTVLEAELAGVDSALIDHIILDYDLPDEDTESALRQAIHHVKQRRSETQGKAGTNPGDGQGNQTAPRDPALAQESSREEKPTEGIVPTTAIPAAIPQPESKPDQEADLFGAVPVAEQSLADAQRAKDEKRSGTKDVPSDIDGGLFSNQSRQTDIASATNPEANATPAPEADAPDEVLEIDELVDEDGVAAATENKSSEIDARANEAATSDLNDRAAPTPAQIDADNYKKGKPFTLHGHRIVIENPRDSMRGDKETGGKKWQNKMAAHYGDLKGTTGADGDALDVFVGQNPESEKVFIIDQQKKSGDKGGFDEHKLLLGFSDKASAEKAYLDSYDKGWGIGPVTELTVEQFNDWIANGDHTKPYAEQFGKSEAGPQLKEGAGFNKGKFKYFKGHDSPPGPYVGGEEAALAQYKDWEKQQSGRDAEDKKQEDIKGQIRSGEYSVIPTLETFDRKMGISELSSMLKDIFGGTAAAGQRFVRKHGKVYGTSGGGSTLFDTAETIRRAHEYWIANSHLDPEKAFSPDALQNSSAAQQNKDRLIAAAKKLAKEKADKALSEKTITEEYEDEDGNTVTVEQSALTKIRQLSKRIEVADKLLGCLKG